MDAETSEKIRDVISFVHSKTLSIGIYSPGDISVTSMYEEAASDLAEIIQQETAKARVDELQRLYVDHDDRKLRHIDGTKLTTIEHRIAELSQPLKELKEEL